MFKNLTFLISFSYLAQLILAYECPSIRKYFSKSSNLIFQDAIYIDGTNMILAQFQNQQQQQPISYFGLLDMSSNQFLQFITTHTNSQNIQFSQSLNLLFSFQGSINIINMQSYEVQNSIIPQISNLIGIQKSSLDSSLAILTTNNFISQYFSLNTGQIVGKQFPTSQSISSNVNSNLSKDHQLQDFQILSQVGIGRIDLYDISTGNLIASKTQSGSQVCACIVEISKTNFLLVSYGTSQLYLWQILQNTNGSLQIMEFLSINIIRYVPLKMNSFIGIDNQSYIALFTGSSSNKHNNQNTYRDIYLLKFSQISSTIDMLEAYPFYALQNQNNYNIDFKNTQISINDPNTILQASTFIPSSQRVYGFSFDTHYLFPFFESQQNKQCDFDLDGILDSYCRFPIMTNRNNIEIEYAFFILNDGNIFIARNNQNNFRVYQSSNLITKFTLNPERFYERCKNCVQRIRIQQSLKQDSSSNVKVDNQDEFFAFPKRFNITGMNTSFLNNWQTNQGAYIYDYARNNLISVNLSSPMSNPSQKIYLNWRLAVSYQYNNLTYYCLSYNIPQQQNIQTGYYDQTVIDNLQLYFNNHNIECYIIDQQYTFQNLYLLQQSNQYNYQIASQQQFDQICDPSYSSIELICINGQSLLNIWSLDNLQWKRETTLSSCNTITQLIIYQNQNIPYIIINCKSQLAIVDSTNLNNFFFILQNSNIQNLLIQSQILFILSSQGSQSAMAFYNFTDIIKNKKDSQLLGQFQDSTSTSLLTVMDYQVSSSTLYFANSESQYIISSINSQFYSNELSQCDLNIYFSKSSQSNLLQQKQQLILNQNVGYPTTFGIGTQTQPYQNEAQIYEGLYQMQNFINMIDLSSRKNNFMINFQLNLDNSKQNPLINSFFQWSIQTANLIIKPYYTIPNKQAIVIVDYENVNISTWSYFQINNIQFLVKSYASVQKYVCLNITKANFTLLNQLSLHQVPSGLNNINKNLISIDNCQQVMISNYLIDSQNITTTSPLFFISNSYNVTIQNISLINNFIEKAAVYDSLLNQNSLITSSTIFNNTFCSYDHYQNYLQQQDSFSDVYYGFTFTANFKISSLNISSNSFCLNSNFILGQSGQLDIQNSQINQNLIQIDKLYFMDNRYMNGLRLQNILYHYSLNQQNQFEKTFVLASFSGIQIQNNKLQDLNLPSSWGQNITIQTNNNYQQYVQQKQIVQCSYIQVNEIQQLDLMQSSIIDEVHCGFISLTQIYKINLNQLAFTNTNQSISQLSRKDSLINIQESVIISITQVNISNTNFLNCIAILLSLEEYNTQVIDFSNNAFQNINLKSDLYYIQVNTVFISTGQSASNIILNDNTFSKITVAFSTSSQTLSSSCIASNSLVSNITMLRNIFNDTYSNSINGALVLNGKSVNISQSLFSSNIYGNINIPTLSSDIQVQGGFLKSKTSYLTITNSTFTDCVTQYGAIYISPSDMNLNITFINTNFINLISFSSGSAIYLSGSQSNLNFSITSSYFSNLYNFYSSNYKGNIKAAIQIDANQNNDRINNQIQLYNLTLENISGVAGLQMPSYFFSVGQSVITVNEIRVKRIILNVVSYIRLFRQLQIYSTVQIFSSIFNVFSSSILNLTNLNIQEPQVNELTHSLQQGSIIHPALLSLASKSLFFGYNITLQNINCNAQGGILYAQDSAQFELINFVANSSNQVYENSLNININLPYQNIQNSLLNFINVQNITMINSNVFCSSSVEVDSLKVIPNICSGKILQAFESQISISDSTFQSYNYKIGNGTGLSLINMKGLNTIQNVYFSNLISTQSGGAIFVYSNFNTQINNNINLVIKNCSFQNNSAQNYGGALAFENHSSNTAIQSINLNINDSKFQNNTAQIAACIFYSNLIPKISNQSNSFINNTAQMGNIIYSSPRSIKLVPSSLLQDSFLSSSEQFQKKLRQNNTSIQLLQASGQEIPTLIFKIYYYDSPVESVESEREVQLSLIDISQLFSQTQIYIKPYQQEFVNSSDHMTTFVMTGQSNIFYNQTGNYVYLNLNLWSVPESDYDIIFNFSMIKIPNYQDNIIQQSYQYVAQIYNRNCSQFETISEPQNIPLKDLSKNVIQCNKCPSLTYAYNQQICQECPKGANCKQDQNIVVQVGYWRRSFDTFTILPCDNNFDSCRGGDTVGNEICKEGYIGALCQECDLFQDFWPDSYAKQGQYSCEKCSHMILSYIFLVLLVIFTVILALASMHSNAVFMYKRIASSIVLKFRKRQSIKRGEDQEQFDLENLPKYTQNSNSSSSYFKIIASYLQILGSLTSFNISVPAFFPSTLNSFGNPIKVSLESMDCLLKDYSRTIPYHFYKYILSITVPLWFYTILIALLFMYQKFKKQKFSKNYLYSGAVFLFIYLQPGLVQEGINLISCVNIGDKSYILSNLSELCYTSDHIIYISYLLIPSIFVFLLLIPLKIFWLFRKNQKLLDKIHFRLKWDLFYHEYTIQNYYWEFIKMYEKLIIIIVLSLFNSQHNVKASLMIVILVIYTYLLIKNKPFKQQIENYIELYATLSCIITIVLVILIIQDGINVILKLLALSTIIFINALTMSFIALKVLVNGINKLLLSKPQFVFKFPNLANKLKSFANFCEKYIFFTSQFFSSFSSNNNDNQQQSPKQDVIPNQNSSFFNPYQSQTNYMNANQSQKQDYSNSFSSQAQQSFFLKYKSKFNLQQQPNYQQKQKNMQRPSQISRQNSQNVVKKQRQLISLNKILNFNIQPHQSIEGLNYPNISLVKQNTQTVNQYNQQANIKKLISSDKQEEEEIIVDKKSDSQTGTLVNNKSSFIDQRYSSFKVLKSPKLNKIDESDTMSVLDNDKEFFIFSEKDLDQKQAQIQQVYSSIQAIGFK